MVIKLSFCCDFSLIYAYQAKSFLLCSMLSKTYVLCSKLCWHMHNRPGHGPTANVHYIPIRPILYMYHIYSCITYTPYILICSIMLHGLAHIYKMHIWITSIACSSCSLATRGSLRYAMNPFNIIKARSNIDLYILHILEVNTVSHQMM